MMRFETIGEVAGLVVGYLLIGGMAGLEAAAMSAVLTSRHVPGASPRQLPVAVSVAVIAAAATVGLGKGISGIAVSAGAALILLWLAGVRQALDMISVAIALAIGLFAGGRDYVISAAVATTAILMLSLIQPRPEWRHHAEQRR